MAKNGLTVDEVMEMAEKVINRYKSFGVTDGEDLSDAIHDIGTLFYEVSAEMLWDVYKGDMNDKEGREMIRKMVEGAREQGQEARATLEVHMAEFGT